MELGSGRKGTVGIWVPIGGDTLPQHQEISYALDATDNPHVDLWLELSRARYRVECALYQDSSTWQCTECTLDATYLSPSWLTGSMSCHGLLNSRLPSGYVVDPDDLPPGTVSMDFWFSCPVEVRASP